MNNAVMTRLLALWSLSLVYRQLLMQPFLRFCANEANFCANEANRGKASKNNVAR
jgi:hypothetical protein